VIDAAWLSEIAEIYGNYAAYHQSSGGTEQAIFEGDSGIASLRSDRILRHLGESVPLPETGRLLDVGCGNGPMLRAFSRFAPGWRLAGSDLDDRCRAEIEAIPGVEALYAGPTDGVPGTFDVISMIHVLEHIANPASLLASLGAKLERRGLLLIEVPNLLQNPFDLLVADHASHFTPQTVGQLVRRSGFPHGTVATDWVFKELSVVARKEGDGDGRGIDSNGDPLAMVVGLIEWLLAVVAGARDCAASGSLGVFGTSIAGTWLASELQGLADFFVDEDRQRVGRSFMGRPVLHPEHVPQGAGVFLALPTPLAESVKCRLARPGVAYHCPPALPVTRSSPVAIGGTS
jgi:2-polyprenyl-3-methyl-5-hydroxy-6-metoxy-1,4-benzoquinol methylase